MVPSAAILKIGANRCVKDLPGGARCATSEGRVGDGAAEEMGEVREKPPRNLAMAMGEARGESLRNLAMAMVMREASGEPPWNLVMGEARGEPPGNLAMEEER